MTSANPKTKPRPGKSKVMLVDDHPIVRQGLANLIAAEEDLTVSAQVESVEAAIKALELERPDIAVVDISLGDRSGLELLKEIRSRWPELPTLALSMHDELLYAERALRAGARGYVMKHEATEKVMDAIRRVLSGETYVSSQMANRLNSSRDPDSVRQDPLTRLSDRELEVFTMIGRGLGTREIANTLTLSVKTVEAHREHIKEKLSLKTGTELMRLAVQYTLAESSGALGDRS